MVSELQEYSGTRQTMVCNSVCLGTWRCRKVHFCFWYLCVWAALPLPPLLSLYCFSVLFINYLCPPMGFEQARVDSGVWLLSFRHLCHGSLRSPGYCTLWKGRQLPGTLLFLSLCLLVRPGHSWGPPPYWGLLLASSGFPTGLDKRVVGMNKGGTPKWPGRTGHSLEVGAQTLAGMPWAGSLTWACHLHWGGRWRTSELG